jgi:hypothetical protein
MISWSVAKLGWLANAAGIAARKEWPEIWDAFFPTCFDSNDLTVSMKTFGVSGLPLVKEKTGMLHAMFLALDSRNLDRAVRGQQLLFSIRKMSMKSPCGFF